MREELDDELYTQITELCDRGNELTEAECYREAIEPFLKALTLIPKPIEKWEASTYILVALGDCFFMLDEFEQSFQYLTHAMRCPGSIGNEFIHLRLGQVQYELGNNARAKDELARAYMGGGAEIFETENPKYLNYLRRFMQDI